MSIEFNGYFYSKEKDRMSLAFSIFLNYFNIRKDINLHFSSLKSEQIKTANRKAFNQSTITDVITLPIYKNTNEILGSKNSDGFIGDILIYRPEVKRNAIKYGKSIAEEMELVLIHGLLHLFGFSHNEEKNLNYHQHRLMERIWNES
tara:strand:+ start:595 stop:1035 length:441 start_codon:yes stop_codon:yes gene_type:complete